MSEQKFTKMPFIKMHGLGNDFVVLDGRAEEINLSASQARAIADRHTGIGCDQVIVIEPAANNSAADAFMRIHNADGGEVMACGNASRQNCALQTGGAPSGTGRLASVSLRQVMRTNIT